MRIEFDTTKDAANVEKHGVALALARHLEWDTLQCKEDTRHSYGELRMVGHAFMGQRLFCVVLVDKGEVRRVISLRKSNQREVKRYVANAIKNQT
jgi:uncharacterized DUF497 family protein